MLILLTTGSQSVCTRYKQVLYFWKKNMEIIHQTVKLKDGEWMSFICTGWIIIC